MVNVEYDTCKVRSMGNARLQKVHGNRMTNARNKTCKTLIIKKQGQKHSKQSYGNCKRINVKSNHMTNARN